MRRSLVTLTLFASAVMAGCDEGPSQPFAAAPAGAGNVWNNGSTTGSVEDGGAPLDADFPTVNPIIGCTPSQQRKIWSAMLSKTLTATSWAGITYVGAPKNKAGVADLGNPDAGVDWSGASMNVAQQINCNAVPTGAGPCPSGNGFCYNGTWGYNGEVGVSWNTQTTLIDQMVITPGYFGPLTFVSQTESPEGWMCPGDVFEFTIGQVPRRHNDPTKIDKAGGAVACTHTPVGGGKTITFEIPWNGSTPDDMGLDYNTILNYLYIAGMDSYAASLGIQWSYGNIGYSCQAASSCLVQPNSGGVSYFGIRPIPFYLTFYGNGVQPTISTPNSLYNFYVKAEPYSHMPFTMKLDHEGPVATQDLLATIDDAGVHPSGNACVQKIGLPYGDTNTIPSLKHDCVDISDPAQNKVFDAKLTGGLNHDYEFYSFNVVGINQNYTANGLPWNQVLRDQASGAAFSAPVATDTAQDFTLDVRTSAPSWNDYGNYYARSVPTAANPVKSQQDERGIAMVYIEWANLMLTDIAQMMGTPRRSLGDPNCLDGNFAPGCSGIEGLLIPTGKVKDNGGVRKSQTFPTSALIGSKAEDVYNWYAYVFTPALSPQNHSAVFQDAVGAQPVDLATASPYFTAYQHVLRRLGSGNPNALPPELRDRRYYYRWFAIAYVKYMRAFGHLYETNNTGAIKDHPELNDSVLPCRANSAGIAAFIAAGGKGNPNYTATPATRPGTTIPSAPGEGVGLCPEDVHAQSIDLEALFFDNIEGATFDVFEYVDRSFIDQNGLPADPANNKAADLNVHPWDFAYGDDLVGGNQRYDHFYQKMDREELALYAALLENKDNHPGTEDNATLTNLFGSPVLASMYVSPDCMLGTGDSNTNGCAANSSNGIGSPPLKVLNDTTCAPSFTAGVVSATSYINGATNFCASYCKATGTASGASCADPNYACIGSGIGEAVKSTGVTGGSGAYCLAKATKYDPCDDGDLCTVKHPGWACVKGPNGLGCVNPADPATSADKNNGCPTGTAKYSAVDSVVCAPLYQDLNGELPDVSQQPKTGSMASPKPFLFRYQGASASSATVFTAGHSPITQLPSDEQPILGVTKVTIPNFTNPYGSEGPYMATKDDAGVDTCADPNGYGDVADPTTHVCLPPQTVVSDLGGTLQVASNGGIQALVPYYPLSYSTASGTGIPIIDPTPNSMRSYIYPAAQLLFQGVLESYNFWYEPYTDGTQPSCLQGNKCNPGYTCNVNGQCADSQGSIVIDGVTASDFLGEIFVCLDPTTQDVLHVRMYDSAQTIVNWLNNHVGAQPFQNSPESNSAQWSCGIVLRYSPYGNALDYIVSTVNGVQLQINPGQGMGRVVGATLYNPGIGANANN